MFLGLFAILSLILDATAQSQCATCPSADLAGNPLIASSGGTSGVPRFCGFSSDAAMGPQTSCFYFNSGYVSYDSNGLCPSTTSLITCTFQ